VDGPHGGRVQSAAEAAADDDAAAEEAVKAATTDADVDAAAKAAAIEEVSSEAADEQVRRRPNCMRPSTQNPKLDLETESTHGTITLWCSTLMFLARHCGHRLPTCFATDFRFRW